MSILEESEKLNIPWPGRGYWAMKAAGKAIPKRPPLRELFTWRRSRLSVSRRFNVEYSWESVSAIRGWIDDAAKRFSQLRLIGVHLVPNW